MLAAGDPGPAHRGLHRSCRSRLQSPARGARHASSRRRPWRRRLGRSRTVPLRSPCRSAGADQAAPVEPDPVEEVATERAADISDEPSRRCERRRAGGRRRVSDAAAGCRPSWPRYLNRDIRILSPGDDGDVNQSGSWTCPAGRTRPAGRTSGWRSRPYRRHDTGAGVLGDWTWNWNWVRATVAPARAPRPPVDLDLELGLSGPWRRVIRRPGSLAACATCWNGLRTHCRRPPRRCQFPARATRLGRLSTTPMRRPAARAPGRCPHGHQRLEAGSTGSAAAAAEFALVAPVAPLAPAPLAARSAPSRQTADPARSDDRPPRTAAEVSIRPFPAPPAAQTDGPGAGGSGGGGGALLLLAALVGGLALVPPPPAAGCRWQAKTSLTAQLVEARAAGLAPARSSNALAGFVPAQQAHGGTMRKRFLALAISGLVLGVGAGPAMADPGDFPAQTAGQFAGNQQAAQYNAKSTQDNPSNSNIKVRVLSPGDDGAVSQENNSYADAEATNENDTDQSVDQSQYGGGGGRPPGGGPGGREPAEGRSRRRVDADEAQEQEHFGAGPERRRQRRGQPGEQLRGEVQGRERQRAPQDIDQDQSAAAGAPM